MKIMKPKETEQSYHERDERYPSILLILLSQVLSCTCSMASDQAFANLVLLTSLIRKFEHQTEFEIAGQTCEIDLRFVFSCLNCQAVLSRLHL